MLSTCEHNLLEQTRQGTLRSTDVQKFQMFHQENLDLVYHYVYRSVRNREEAEDLTSHIFLKAFCLVDWERHPGIVKFWLFQVVRTTLADYWRTRFHDPTCSLEELLEAGWDSFTEKNRRE